MLGKGLLLISGVLGITGIGIYSMMPNSFNANKLSSKHKKIFEEMHKTFSYRKFSRPNSKKAMEIEVIDPDDPWWNQKWGEYKNRMGEFSFLGEEAKSSLENFQRICYFEIKKRGSNLVDVANYSEDNGRLNSQSNVGGHMSYSDVEDKKFVWELCLKTSVFEG